MEAAHRTLDWSQLNEELVHLISKKFPDLSDFVRFRAVCKQWRSAVPCSDPSPRFPWIYQHRNSLQSDFDFYSLPYAKTITFESSDKSVGTGVGVGSPAKYLLSHTYYHDNWKSMMMAPLNPPLRSLIPVPPPRDWYRLKMMKSYDVCSVERNGEYGFFFENIIYEKKYNFGLCPSNEWIFKEDNYQGDGNAYLKGMYFHDCPSDGTTVTDIYSGKVLSEIPPQERANLEDPCMHCLIESSSGDLLKVYRPYDIDLDLEEIYFEVYRLYMDKEQAFWIEVKDIGDEMLFLDYSATGLALSAGDFAGCEGNSIYFLKGEILEDADHPSFILCRYNLGDSTIEKLPYESEKWGTWVMPFLG